MARRYLMLLMVTLLPVLLQAQEVNPFQDFPEFDLPEIPAVETLTQNPETTASLPEVDPHQFQGLAWYNFETNSLDLGSSNPGDFWLSSQTLGLNISYQYKNLLTLSSLLRFNPKAPENLDLSQVFSQLYLRLIPSSWAYLTMGKQAVKWGNYRFFSTLDSLDPVTDILSPLSQNQGQALFQSVLIPTDWLSFTLLLMPEDNLRWIRGGVKADLLLGEVDGGLGVVKYQDLYRRDFASLALSPQRVDRWALFAEASWFPTWFGFYAEATYKMESLRQYVSGTDLIDLSLTGALRVTVGTQMTLPSWNPEKNLSLIMEYFYNQEGLSSTWAEDWLSRWENQGSSGTKPLFPTTFGELCQHYGGVRLGGLPLLGNLSMDLTVLMNLEGGLAIGQSSIHWNWGQGVLMGLSYQIQGTLPWWNGHSLNEGLFMPSGWFQRLNLFWQLSF